MSGLQARFCSRNRQSEVAYWLHRNVDEPLPHRARPGKVQQYCFAKLGSHTKGQLVSHHISLNSSAVLTSACRYIWHFTNCLVARHTLNLPFDRGKKKKHKQRKRWAAVNTNNFCKCRHHSQNHRQESICIPYYDFSLNYLWNKLGGSVTVPTFADSWRYR
jgi:hypothetical protein